MRTDPCLPNARSRKLYATLFCTIYFVSTVYLFLYVALPLDIYKKFMNTVVIHVEGPPILYVIRSHPTHYGTRLAWQRETWLMLASQKDSVLVETDKGNEEEKDPAIKYFIAEGCLDSHGEGLCCQEAQIIEYL